MPYKKKSKNKLASKILPTTKIKKFISTPKPIVEEIKKTKIIVPFAESNIEVLAGNFTKWIGSVPSLLIHTILFLLCFVAGFMGVSWDEVLLILTTIVSLEAIYLAIFIQMSINKTSESLANVEQDIDELAEGVEDIAEDVEDIAEDVEDIAEDLEEIQVDVSDIQKDIDEIQDDVTELSEDLEDIAKEDKKGEKRDIFQKELLKNIHKNMSRVKTDMERLKTSQQKQMKMRK
jgi:uncharacterized protein YoxC